jgi:ATP-dependent DNA helicase RecQ
LDTRHLEERRRIELEKAEAVIEYAVTSNACRSVMIQNYFGETATRDCGVCDYCVEKMQHSKQVEYDKNIRQSLLNLMHSGGVSLIDIVNSAPEPEKDMWIGVIREMLDNEELYYDQSGMLHQAGGNEA